MLQPDEGGNTGRAQGISSFLSLKVISGFFHIIIVEAEGRGLPERRSVLSGEDQLPVSASQHITSPVTEMNIGDNAVKTAERQGQKSGDFIIF